MSSPCYHNGISQDISYKVYKISDKILLVELFTILNIIIFVSMYINYTICNFKAEDCLLTYIMLICELGTQKKKKKKKEICEGKIYL